MTFYIGIIHAEGGEICQSVNQFGEGVWTIELAPHFSLCSCKNLLRQPIYRWKDLVETFLSLFRLFDNLLLLGGLVEFLQLIRFNQ